WLAAARRSPMAAASKWARSRSSPQIIALARSRRRPVADRNSLGLVRRGPEIFSPVSVWAIPIRLTSRRTYVEYALIIYNGLEARDVPPDELRPLYDRFIEFIKDPNVTGACGCRSSSRRRRFATRMVRRF